MSEYSEKIAISMECSLIRRAISVSYTHLAPFAGFLFCALLCKIVSFSRQSLEKLSIFPVSDKKSCRWKNVYPCAAPVSPQSFVPLQVRLSSRAQAFLSLAPEGPAQLLHRVGGEAPAVLLAIGVEHGLSLIHI